MNVAATGLDVAAALTDVAGTVHAARATQDAVAAKSKTRTQRQLSNCEKTFSLQCENCAPDRERNETR
jgi:hypothetical protein